MFRFRFRVCLCSGYIQRLSFDSVYEYVSGCCVRSAAGHVFRSRFRMFASAVFRLRFRIYPAVTSIQRLHLDSVSEYLILIQRLCFNLPNLQPAVIFRYIHGMCSDSVSDPPWSSRRGRRGQEGRGRGMPKLQQRLSRSCATLRYYPPHCPTSCRGVFEGQETAATAVAF